MKPKSITPFVDVLTAVVWAGVVTRGHLCVRLKEGAHWDCTTVYMFGAGSGNRQSLFPDICSNFGSGVFA